MDEALRVMRDHPLRTLGLWLKKVWLHWIYPEIPNVSPLDAWPRHSSLLRILLVPYGILSALGLAGLMLLGWRPGSWRIWGVAILVLVGTQSIFFVITRYRIVLVPMLALFTSAFLEELFRRRGRALVLPVGLLVLSVLIVQPWGQRRYLYDLHSAGLANEALRWQSLGQHDLAHDDVAAAHQAWTQMHVPIPVIGLRAWTSTAISHDRSSFWVGRSTPVVLSSVEWPSSAKRIEPSYIRISFGFPCSWGRTTVPSRSLVRTRRFIRTTWK